MSALSRSDLWSLEEYAEQRPTFRAQVMEHKKHRQLSLGENIRLCFEDRLTIRYQIQEMLRIEKIFEAPGINEELDAYNPLVPDGQNWKATLMIEFDDPEERAQRLAQLIGVENRVWLQVADCEKVYPFADEDMERANEEKTSSVHFLRYELSGAMIGAVQHGSDIHAGVDHVSYPLASVKIPSEVSASLAHDLDKIQLN